MVPAVIIREADDFAFHDVQSDVSGSRQAARFRNDMPDWQVRKDLLDPLGVRSGNRRFALVHNHGIKKSVVLLSETVQQTHEFTGPVSRRDDQRDASVGTGPGPGTAAFRRIGCRVVHLRISTILSRFRQSRWSGCGRYRPDLTNAVPTDRATLEDV